MEATNVYRHWDSSCSSIPVWMSMEENSSCAESDCNANKTSDYTLHSTSCPSDAKTYAADDFGSSEYLYIDKFSDTDCSNYESTEVVLASGQCQGYGSAEASVDPDDLRQWYYQELAETHACYQKKRYYTNADLSRSGSNDSSSEVTIASTTSSSSSGLGVGATVGIIVGPVVLVVAAGLFLRKRRRRRRWQPIPTPDGQQVDEFHRGPMTPKESERDSTTDYLKAIKLWDDAAIVAARIPREKVLSQQLINRGGFGEVYAGTYNGEHVAVKMLLPERRKDLKQVSAFLCEVKLMTTLEHPRIVTFIGVVWDSLTDLCVVTTDLKTLLAEVHEHDQPSGFNHDKVKVALHVAHALAYLHSCAPPVIHRDLKSSNILVSDSMDAKLTDFGTCGCNHDGWNRNLLVATDRNRWSRWDWLVCCWIRNSDRLQQRRSQSPPLS